VLILIAKTQVCKSLNFLSTETETELSHYRMTIAEIKAQLSIHAVLAHYGLEASSTGSLPCPFHADAKASMKIYPETNTAYCFAGGCEVDSVDVIDFIMHMEKCDKRAAILKAKEMCGRPVTMVPTTPVLAAPKLDLRAIYEESIEGIQRTPSGREYCDLRGLDPNSTGIGYRSRKAKERWGRGCIIFPLVNEGCKVVGLYGRAVKGGGHYYTTDRRGLYPEYPDATTTRLLLTESVIDAASINGVLDDFTVLALYGTNGLTAAHRLEVKGLKDLTEVVLALDGDEAGRKATATIAAELRALRPGLTVTTMGLPDGEDINGMWVSHTDEEAGWLRELYLNRQAVAGGDTAAPTSAAPAPAPNPTPSLDTDNPHNLIYRSAVATYEIKGGIRHAAKDLDCLKITAVVTNATGRKSRQKLDLYEDKQITRAAQAVADRLGLRADLVELDFDRLTDLLEVHRDGLRQNSERKQAKTVAVAGADRGRCLAFLKSDDLLTKINKLIERGGIAGEEKNRLLLFVVASSHRMKTTLHALIQGASGSGKTRLLRMIAKMMPEESTQRYTRVTEGSLYNQGEYFLQNKLVCLEDLDGLREEALYAVRELQSGDTLVSATSLKNEFGNSDAAVRTVRGPIASMSCTTKAEVYEDNVSRCFVVAMDESRAQSVKIIEYQNKKSAGKIDGDEEKRARAFLQNCVRLLEPLPVVNPYADRIELPADAQKIRRLNDLYQSFVAQVTLINQYRRERDGRGRVVTAPEDLRVACEVLFESIVLKVDELDGSLRQFFERVKKYVGGKSESYAFNRFELREAIPIGKTQQHHHLNRLVELEYLQREGFANRGYRYKIVHWDDMQAVRKRIKNDLLNQLKDL